MARPIPDDLSMLASERFTYDPETGHLYWRDPGSAAFETLKAYRVFARLYAGKQAGCIHKSGYVRIFLDGRSYQAHRLIWAMVTGHDAGGDIDHKDGDRSNNRWVNLREATRSQNCMNRGANANSKTGIKGVHWHRAAGKWAASITAKNVGTIHLGVFSTKERAAAAYEQAARVLHGEFAREAAA